MGADATNVIYASGAHSNIPSTNMYVATQTKEGLKFHHHIILEDGTEGYKKYVREKEGLFLTDTTWRDAHQSLLTIRVITQEITNAANFTNLSLRYYFYLYMWGDSTFDVTVCFLHKFSLEHSKTLREMVLDVQFQMLLRGANTMG